MLYSWFFRFCEKWDDVKKRHETKTCAETLEALVQELKDNDQMDKLDAEAKLYLGLMEQAPNKYQVRYCMTCLNAILPNNAIPVLGYLSCGGVNCFQRSQHMDHEDSPCPWYTLRTQGVTDADFAPMWVEARRRFAAAKKRQRQQRKQRKQRKQP